MKENYEDLLQQLVDGKIKTLVVKPENFNDFWQAFEKSDARNEITGTAAKGGVITYRFSESV